MAKEEGEAYVDCTLFQDLRFFLFFGVQFMNLLFTWLTKKAKLYAKNVFFVSERAEIVVKLGT